MACCNDKRARWATSIPGGPRMEAAGTGASGAPPLRTVEFEYVGATSLRVTGPMTRAHYVFGQPGARMAVDQRDAPYMAAVPNLRRAR
jgi:hypothetical protein